MSGVASSPLGATTAKGLLEHPALGARFEPGTYEAILRVADYYRRQKDVPLPNVPFLDVVTYRFGLSDPQQHYHLPFKCTPWGYSCFRGDAWQTVKLRHGPDPLRRRVHHFLGRPAPRHALPVG